MDQLHNADKIAMQGEVKDQALSECDEQLRSWEVAVPRNKALVLDFGLGEFKRNGLIEFWIANEEEVGYCGKYLFLFGGQSCPAHSHYRKHETFFVVRGNILLVSEGQQHALSAGDAFQIPPRQIHGFSATQKAALVLELSSPCRPDDNQFVDDEAQKWLRKHLGLV